MAIVYSERPELMQKSRTVNELYFAALELLEVLDDAGYDVLDELVLTEDQTEQVDRLRRAVQAYQGEEMTPNGSDHKD